MASAPAAIPANADFARARRAMIDSQLRTSGIGNTLVLNAMGATAREDYVPADRRAVAYADRTVPLANGRALASPLAQAMILTEASPRADETMLLIGGGTGYVAALFAPLVATLHVVESDRALMPDGAEKFGEWHDGPLEKGWKRGGPYDLIVVDGAVEEVPSAIAGQLVDDGRIVTGIVEHGVTRLAIGRRVGKDIALQPLAEIGLPVLKAFEKPARWSF